MTSVGIRDAGRLLQWRPLLTILIVIGVLAFPVAVWLDLRGLAERLLRLQAIEVDNVMDDVRNFYTSDVVGRVLEADGQVRPSHLYRDVHGAIPVPATLSIELGKRISRAGDSVQYSFVSDYPFRGRPPHDLNAFETGALAALRQDSSRSVVDVAGSLNDVHVRIASPVIMGEVCVACHNSHPDSTRTDWAVGDVRGIQEIAVTRSIAENIFSFKYLLGYFLFAGMTGLGIIAFQRRQSLVVQAMNGELVAANSSLASTNAEIAGQKREIEALYEERSRQAEILEETVRIRTQDLRLSQSKLETLIEHGIALGSERDEQRLLENILLAAKGLSGADGGTLYTLDRGNELTFQIVRNDTLDIRLGGTSGEEITFPAVKMTDPETGRPNHNNVASHVAITARSINIPDAYTAEGFDFSGTRAFDQRTGYRSKSFLTVPLRTRQGDIIGVLQLINAKDPETGEIVPFDAQVEGFVEALASQAAVALDNQNLLTSLQRLLDSFIELIAGAIDAKSPYTAGHCARVPELARMLAEAACAQQSGPFAAFDMNADQRYEFHIASWLHDCGKVTTPEYVVDKATKLETIYNRIHEVRTRFEVLICEAHADYWRGVAEGGDAAALATERDRSIERLRDDFEFVARCNIGGEFMDDTHKSRLRDIATRTWTRHLDDRIGVSNAEAERLGRVPAPPLPATEPLLADREEHIVRRRDPNPFGDNRWGFQMTVPEHLYNYGEVYNLCVERGTLTAEERFKINEHIVQTIMMLEQLPFPDSMKRVPEFAGGHHETLVGTGYPRRLKKDDMSVPARIMAVADVFEALTDPSRPYARTKTLSEALSIMCAMVRGSHIDPDLFRLFLTSGVPQAYAERYMLPEQVDAVDVERCLAEAESNQDMG